jgi:hypothetical protein
LKPTFTTTPDLANASRAGDGLQFFRAAGARLLHQHVFARLHRRERRGRTNVIGG